jgi:hypothetical protein
MSHLSDDDLVLHYYDELEASDAGAARAHLRDCRECSQRYTTLQRVLATVEAVPAPALPESFERAVWARLEPSLPKRRSWFAWLVTTPSNLAWAATVVILVAGAFFAGRMSREDAGAGKVMTAEQIREGILLSDLSEHLDRSQTMLVELVTQESAGDAVDISLERDAAEDLVAANRLYRQAASATGDTPIAQLLDDLEQLLVELAASPGTVPAGDLERVRQRITAKDLLFKVRVMSSAVREKQQQQIRVRTGQSS